LQEVREIILYLVLYLQRAAVAVRHQGQALQGAGRVAVLEGRKQRGALVIRHQLHLLKELMVALVRPPMVVAEVAAQVKQVILMVFVMVVTALRHLLLERLSSMLVVAVAVLNLRLLGH
jgi:hypothetical protein